MRTQYLNSKGQVVLSKWWRTPSAKAAFRREKAMRIARLANARAAAARKREELALIKQQLEGA
jgi:hypothetical protein